MLAHTDRSIAIPNGLSSRGLFDKSSLVFFPENKKARRKKNSLHGRIRKRAAARSGIRESSDIEIGPPDSQPVDWHIIARFSPIVHRIHR